MSGKPTLALTLSLSMALLGACAPAAQPPQPREPEPARARAALSTVFVENRTGQRLTIAYRLASRGASEIVVGTVEPDSVVRLAPLPAGEPLILVARTAEGREYTLEPRSFQMSTEWTWLIDGTARFVAPEES